MIINKPIIVDIFNNLIERENLTEIKDNVRIADLLKGLIIKYDIFYYW